VSNEQKRYAIVVNDRAAQMLYTHIRFVANVSIPAARKLKTTLYDAIASLERMPFRCTVYRTHNTSDSYHQLIVGRYKLIFSINEKDMIVNIRYILDSRHDNDDLGKDNVRAFSDSLDS